MLQEAAAVFAVVCLLASSVTASEKVHIQPGRLAGIGGEIFQRHASIRSLQDFEVRGPSLGNEGDEGDSLPKPTTPTPRSVLTVRSALELQLGITRGFPHIEIKEHLDLSELEPIAIAGTAGLIALLGAVPPEVWTIRGNCSTDPPPELLLRIASATVSPVPRQPNMCILLAPQDVLYHRSKNLWLENLYIRVNRNQTAFNSAVALVSVSDPAFDSHLWMTNSYLQGDGGPKVNGLTVSSKAYVGGTRFLNLGFGEPPIVLRLNRSSLSLEGCIFSANNVDARLGTITYDGNDTSLVSVADSTFAADNVAKVNLFGSNRSLWFTDGCMGGSGVPCNASTVAPSGSGVQHPTMPLDRAPADGDSLLASDDPWLLRARDESDAATSVKLMIEEAADATGRDGMSLGAIVGIAAAALVPLFATAAILVWRWRAIHTALSEAPESVMSRNPHGSSSAVGSRLSTQGSQRSSSNAPHLRPPPFHLLPTVPSSSQLNL